MLNLLFSIRAVFGAILNQIHDAGYLHGNLTSECLLLDHSHPGRWDTSIVGFGHAISSSSGISQELFNEQRKREAEKLRYLLSVAGQKARITRIKAQHAAKKLAKESDRKAQERQSANKILYPKRRLRSRRKISSC